MSLHLALKEMWRNKGRYILVSLVVALITTLVLFIAALAEGLAAANIQYLSKLNADLILYKKNADLSVQASRIRLSEVNDVARLEGVSSAGVIGSSNATLVFGSDKEPLDVSLLGVEPGKPGVPPALQGRTFQSESDETAIIGRNVALRTGLQVGDTMSLQTVQGAEEEIHAVEIVGLSDGRQNLFQPSVFVPFLTWSRIKPKATPDDGQNNDLVANIIAIRLQNPEAQAEMIRRIEAQLPDFQAVDRQTAYQSTPGYSTQQITLDTQRAFTLVIGVLVIGGFFQIQTLQKIPQIGMLKAIGTSNGVIALVSIIQIVIVTVIGVAVGGLGSTLLALLFPETMPLRFTGGAVALAVGSLLLIGPIGGLVSIRAALNVEPLRALGLSQ